jgi:hypothetical protein
LSGKKVLVSAGPDGKFDTEDEIRIGQANRDASYQPNYQGCTFFQRDNSARWYTQGHLVKGLDDALEGLSERKNGRGMRRRGFGGGGGGGGGRVPSRGIPPPAAPAPRPAVSEKAKKADREAEPGEPEQGGAMPSIRVREYFPETLLWKPALITDADGRARLSVDMADSITTWRLTASANTADGLLGSTTSGILVFQPFFVDIDFPVALTQNDSVSVPVAVYNYLKEPQTITLKVDTEDWFILRDDPIKKIHLQAGEVSVVYFRLQVKGLGHRKLTVYAWGKDEEARDAIRRSVEVLPDGKKVEVVINGRLSNPIRRQVEIPANAIPDSLKVFCKCYPGVFSQIIEGVEGILGSPHG